MASRHTCGGLRLPSKPAEDAEVPYEAPRPPFAFLSLPAELRNDVCEYLVCESTTPTRLSQRCDCDAAPHWDDTAELHSPNCSLNVRQLLDSPLVALAATCQQLRTECLATFLRDVKIRVEDVRFIWKLYPNVDSFKERTLTVTITREYGFDDRVNLHYLLSSAASQPSFTLRFDAESDMPSGYAQQLNRLVANKNPQWVKDLRNNISGIGTAHGSRWGQIWIMFKPSQVSSYLEADEVENLQDVSKEVSSEVYEGITGLDETWKPFDMEERFGYMLGIEGRIEFC
ncbi:hypothetical protein BDV96DRAFT_596455 [Lophiotrema nucula]|uniref:F-box domain-containing protein n=1 Tax=Lophiotrema nucula TaxID=690887 RepID=A0A6A5ZKG6_9PLEO|nr:hypothetical protein BDV96DRAFT_596455 [Lophiotrema nucula]